MIENMEGKGKKAGGYSALSAFSSYEKAVAYMVIECLQLSERILLFSWSISLFLFAIDAKD